MKGKIMRLCQVCWKNLKNEPANLIKNKINKNAYLICNDCKKTEVIQTMIESEKWEIILTTPTLQEIQNEK